MSFIQVKNVPEDLHDAVRRRAAEEAMTVSDYLLDLVQRDLCIPSRREWLARLVTRQPVEINAVELLDGTRAQREDELTQLQS